ncbi:hypothetical protein DPMN_007155 [Dreissena polymorpha]|uniref:Uncharacterized protein n=1 Tax=Dreissena polymorpha TaxID=45954 RepID=A0A9D4RVQ6_DREPO|nr:hypothetical protein DPMN_007155 [Dreissena polymorpha]
MLMTHVKHITHHHLFIKHDQSPMGRRKQSSMHGTAITVYPCVRKTTILPHSSLPGEDIATKLHLRATLLQVMDTPDAMMRLLQTSLTKPNVLTMHCYGLMISRTVSFKRYTG